MKFLLVACFALVSVASGFPAVSQWTLHELSEAIQDPSTHPMVLPYLEQAMNDMMASIFGGVDQNIATVILPAYVANVVGSPAVVPPVIVAPEAPVQESQKSPLVQIILNINGNQAAAPVDVAPVVVPGSVVPAPVVSQWTLHELSEAMQNPSTDPLLMPYIEHALNEMMANLFSGGDQSFATIVLPAEVAQAIANPVATPAVVQSEWTLHEISNALHDPNTDALLLPHLEQAMNEMMAAIWAGQEVSTAIITMPAPVAAVQLPALVDVPVAAPAVVAPVQPASSPLVSITVNIRDLSAPAPVVPEVVAPEIVGVMPVVPEVVAPEFVGVMPVVPEVVAPEFVDVMPVVVPEIVAPEIVGVMPVLPEVVGVAPAPVNPIEVIAVEPPALNPIDSVAVEAPEINPIDVISPVAGVGGPGGILV